MRKINYLLCSFIIINAHLAFGAQYDSPRDTMQAFLKSMVRIKNNEGSQKENYKVAISTFADSSSLNYEAGKKYANQLIKTIDKIRKVDYQKIPNQQDKKWYFDQSNFRGKPLEISISKYDNNWLFTHQTLDSLNDYQKLLKADQTIVGVKKFVSISDKLRGELPQVLLKRKLLLENWQWIGIFVLFILAFLIDILSHKLISLALRTYSEVVKNNTTNILEETINPLSKIFGVYFIKSTFHLLDLPVSFISVLDRFFIVALSIMFVWLGHKVVELLSYYATQKSKTTDTKFDDILIPLVTKSAFVFIYLIGAVVVLNSFTVDVTSIVAGLGIGGLAFAFAAKDALANFFGSLMLVLDRPFDIGDIIIAGSIEGTVTEVGFRSTRIRTFDDSLVTISNGALMNMAINNLGKRRYRRISTTLGLEYDTPPEKIEAFCEGVRQIILSHKWTKKDSFHVYFVNYGASSLDIQLKVMWDTMDYAREMAEKHRLNIDILRLANELEVGFAFPTQTVHLFNEDKVSKANITEKFLDAGIDKAKQLVSKPISLKNPRSNSQDKEQFGDNDIGI